MGWFLLTLVLHLALHSFRILQTQLLTKILLMGLLFMKSLIQLFQANISLSQSDNQNPELRANLFCYAACLDSRRLGKPLFHRAEGNSLVWGIFEWITLPVLIPPPRAELLSGGLVGQQWLECVYLCRELKKMAVETLEREIKCWFDSRVECGLWSWH